MSVCVCVCDLAQIGSVNCFDLIFPGHMNCISEGRNNKFIEKKKTFSFFSVLKSDPSTEPDMVAVYILLGCLALSGLVILGIVIYCTAHCWRKKCFKSRQGLPTIRISTSVEDGYVSLKHSRKLIRFDEVVFIEINKSCLSHKLIFNSIFMFSFANFK